MGCVGSFCKKVWSGIKCVASAVWTGVKTVAKVVVKAVGYIGGIIVNIAKKALLVAATVIAGVLKKFALTIFLGAFALLSIVFLTFMIIFGRDNENENDNHEKNDNTKDGNNRVQINLQGGDLGKKPDFEKEKEKKYFNLKRIFVKNVITLINDSKNKNLKDNKKYTYSFSFGENDEIIVEKLNDNIKQDLEKVLVSRCVFSFSQFQNANLINISMTNEIEDIEKGKKILESIKDALNSEGKYSFNFYEENDNNKPEEKDVDEISDIGTILIRAII